MEANGELSDAASFSFEDEIRASAEDSELRLTVESGNLTLGELDADSVYANVVSGSILDGGYSPLQVVATDAELIASGSIAAAADEKLDTQIGTLALSSGGSVYFQQYEHLDRYSWRN